MKKINLVVASFSFKRGGAAIAANRFCNLLEPYSNIKIEKISADQTSIFHFIKRLISHGLLILQKDNIHCKKSINLFSLTKLISAISNGKDKKLFHFHWINNDTLSVFSLKSIPNYSVITLHDEWLYCGIEHYHYFNDIDQTFISGYKKRLKYVDISYYIWKVKLNNLKNRDDLIYTVPSSWMLERAKKSKILEGKDIRLLFNPIDTTIFSPNTLDEIKIIKDEFKIPHNNIIIMFGAIDGGKNRLKGAESLIEALDLLQKKSPNDEINKITLLTFGGEFNAPQLNFPIVNLGYIKDPHKLAKIYSLANVMVVPSLVEAFGQVAAEAQACGVPVIGYDNTGLTDIIKNNETGFIVKNNDSNALCDAILKVITLDQKIIYSMKKNARKNILINFSSNIIENQYLSILTELANKKLTS